MSVTCVRRLNTVGRIVYTNLQEQKAMDRQQTEVKYNAIRPMPSDHRYENIKENENVGPAGGYGNTLCCHLDRQEYTERNN